MTPEQAPCVTCGGPHDRLSKTHPYEPGRSATDRDLDMVRVPVVNLRCSGCGWRAAASTLALLNRASRQHDDSPRTQHIVTLDPPQHWPESDTEFASLLSPPPGGRREEALSHLAASTSSAF